MRLTPDVTEIVSPNATWPAVRSALQGATLVIYLGHGNGFPSPYRSTLAPASEDGFGLNPVAGGDNVAHQYFGEAYIARSIHLAPGATVVLARLCYASGNPEPGRPEATAAVAAARVDNYAAGFLAAGAGSVIADAFASPAYYVRSILGAGSSPLAAWLASPTAAGHVSSFAVSRTPGTAGWVDPSSRSGGWYRSLVARAVDPASANPGAGSGGAWLPYQFVLPTDPPGAVALPAGATLGVPDLAAVPIAGSTVELSVPLAVSAGATLTTRLGVGVSWEAVDGAFGGGSSGSGASLPGTDNPGATASPGPAASPSPGPKASAGPSGTAPPSASAGPTAPASPAATAPLTGGPSPSAAASPSPVPSAGDGAGSAFVAAELPASVTDPVPATVTATGIAARVAVPTTPGTYRVVVTVHGADGVALDASATIPPILVRVLPPGGATISAPRSLTTLPGASLSMLVTVTNGGPADWAADASRVPAASPGTTPAGVLAGVRLTGTWIPLDVAAAPAAAGSMPLVAQAGTTVPVPFAGTAPDAPGTYLLVLALAVDEAEAVPAAIPSTTVVTVRSGLASPTPSHSMPATGPAVLATPASATPAPAPTPTLAPAPRGRR